MIWWRKAKYALFAVRKFLFLSFQLFISVLHLHKFVKVQKIKTEKYFLNKFLLLLIDCNISRFCYCLFWTDFLKKVIDKFLFIRQNFEVIWSGPHHELKSSLQSIPRKSELGLSPTVSQVSYGLLCVYYVVVSVVFPDVVVSSRCSPPFSLLWKLFFFLFSDEVLC